MTTTVFLSSLSPLAKSKTHHQFGSKIKSLRNPSFRFIPKSALLSISEPSISDNSSNVITQAKPSAAENSRSIMELSSSGTLSTVTHDGWPIGIAAQFVVDHRGSPAICLNNHEELFHARGQSSFHVQLEQNKTRMAQCTVMGNLTKPDDVSLLRQLCAKWEKKFGAEVDEELVYTISVEKVLHIEDFKEEGVWVPSLDYLRAEPDPLRNFAEKIVDEMNSEHVEDVQRLCKVYVDLEFQVTDAKIVWVDRRGFDMYMYSDSGIFSVRIPFPREVIDEKGVKSTFNSMSHFAWEIEKNYASSNFERVNCFKRIR